MPIQPSPDHQPVVFIIEDEPTLSSIFTIVLRRAGFQIEAIMAGDVALARLSTSTPDIVMLDLHLPGVSGVDILNYIRSDSRFVETRVVIITADWDLGKKILIEGEIVLRKPISIDDLWHVVKDLRPDG